MGFLSGFLCMVLGALIMLLMVPFIYNPLPATINVDLPHGLYVSTKEVNRICNARMRMEKIKKETK